MINSVDLKRTQGGVTLDHLIQLFTSYLYIRPLCTFVLTCFHVYFYLSIQIIKHSIPSIVSLPLWFRLVNLTQAKMCCQAEGRQ